MNPKQLNKAIDRLVEYCSGATLFGDEDTRLYNLIYTRLKEEGCSAEKATRIAHRQVISEIFVEELE